jgi:hypothetical protein
MEAGGSTTVPGQMERFEKEAAYTAGVMHDIGCLAMASNMPELYDQVVETPVDQPWDLLERERQTFWARSLPSRACWPLHGVFPRLF